MAKYGLHESIVTCLIWGLNWHTEKGIQSMPGVLKGSIEEKVTLAIKEQTDIGWKNVRRGFISKKWAEIQQEYDTSKKLQPKQWNTTIIQWLLEYSWEMWKERNQALHGTNMKETREKRLEQLRREVGYLYSRVANLPKPHSNDVKQMFKLKEENRKKKGVVALETWINIATKIVKVAEEAAPKLKQTELDEWLNRTMTYQECSCNPTEDSISK